jgi:hypothetical protein
MFERTSAIRAKKLSCIRLLVCVTGRTDASQAQANIRQTLDLIDHSRDTPSISHLGRGYNYGK